MRWLRVALAIAAAAIAVTPAMGAQMAIQDDQLPNMSGAALEQRLDLLQSTGTSITRVDILWGFVAPTRPADASDPGDPAYDWARYDAIITGLRARDITPIVDFAWTPTWGSSSGKRNAAPRTAELGRGAGHRDRAVLGLDRGHCRRDRAVLGLDRGTCRRDRATVQRHVARRQGRHPSAGAPHRGVERAQHRHVLVPAVPASGWALRARLGAGILRAAGRLVRADQGCEPHGNRHRGRHRPGG